MLFGEDPVTIKDGIVGAIVGGLVLLAREVLPPLFRFLISYRTTSDKTSDKQSDKRRKERIEDEDRELRRMDAMLARLENEIKERDKEHRAEMDKAEVIIEKLREELRQADRSASLCHRKLERARAWIQHLSALLDERKISYPKWDDVGGDGSGSHVPLT